MKNVRSEFRREINSLREDVNNLRSIVVNLSERVSRLEGSMSLFVKLFIIFNVPILIGIIGILLKMIFTV